MIRAAGAAPRSTPASAPSIRLRVPADREVVFPDLVRGEVTFHTDVIGDPVLVRSDGMPAYNFAVVIDDALMAITHVVRGEDHISNTPRQILLYEAFGWTPPRSRTSRWCSVPITRRCRSGTARRRSPSSASTGYLPEALVTTSRCIGWSPGEGEELLPLDELARRVSTSRTVGHSAGVFDDDKLAWVNRHYLKHVAPGFGWSLCRSPYLRRGRHG